MALQASLMVFDVLSWGPIDRVLSTSEAMCVSLVT